MKKASELDIRGTVVRVVKIGDEDYICLTDMLKANPTFHVQTSLRLFSRG